MRTNYFDSQFPYLLLKSEVELTFLRIANRQHGRGLLQVTSFHNQQTEIHTMMRFLYGKKNPALLEAQDADSPRIQKASSGEDHVIHLPDTVIASAASGPTRDYPHVFIHEGDKRSQLCRKDYFIRVPSAALPGNTFHVTINGEDYQVTCPEIERVGQKIVVTLERPEKFAHE